MTDQVQLVSLSFHLFEVALEAFHIRKHQLILHLLVEMGLQARVDHSLRLMLQLLFSSFLFNCALTFLTAAYFSGGFLHPLIGILLFGIEAKFNLRSLRYVDIWFDVHIANV